MRSSPVARGNPQKGGAWGLLFALGTILPSLWAMWVVLRIGVANSPLFGSQTDDPTYPRNVPELWATAMILTIATAAYLTIVVRSTTRHTSTTVFTILTAIAAATNWAILLLP